ncbi:hypothetical protein [Leptospira mayottensis]|uniref:hypothetical protein n=1 Tax=Leptospira mayottensis TaxID=1137606 RepID=UPI0002BD7D88|nr:hypothetical protein [Leptospira mayottensis]TGM98023.1 hypothetical protein EHR03_14910 [Leptospira mayottensis]
MKPKRRIVSKNRDTHSICFLRLPITSAIVCSPANLQARDRIRFSAFLQDLFILVSVILTWIVKIPLVSLTAFCKLQTYRSQDSKDAVLKGNGLRSLRSGLKTIY